MRRLVAMLFVLLFSAPLFAQNGSATLTGFVQDPSKAVVPGVKVVVIKTNTNTKFTATTGRDGSYTISALPVGPYRMEVEKSGFKTILKEDIFLHTQDALQINFEMAVGSTSESITVNATSSSVANENPAVSMTVSREFVENMPLNGRSLQDLIQLAPGTVSAPGHNGNYSVDGQRTDANSYTVDGVSANLGGYISNNGSSSAAMSGSTSAQTALGTTQSLASVDSLQEFKIQTSGYSAEFGRSPGGQVSFATRSGTNAFHGTLFDYFRNTALDARTYQENYYNEPKAAERQNDFGGSVGGPIRIPHLYDGKDTTFFFFNYEGLRLFLPGFISEYVPTQAFRDWANPTVQPFLNASPLPNPSSPGNQDGCTVPDPVSALPTACDALFAEGISQPSNLDNISIRFDRNLGRRFSVFARFADTPSSYTTGGGGQYFETTVNTHTWTVGATARVANNVVDDFRFNSSHNSEASIVGLEPSNGSVPWAPALLTPVGYENPLNFIAPFIFIPGTAISVAPYYQGSGTKQHQYQIVNSLEWTRNQHNLKFGGDWRRLSNIYSTVPYESLAELTSLDDVEHGNVTSLSISATAPGQPTFNNVSLYVQDHWKVKSRLSLDYGIRWEVNPPPGPSNGEYPVALTSGNLATAQLAPLGTAPYKTAYDHVAPRIGFAWNAIPSSNHALTVRGGFGIFFDTAQQAIGTAYQAGYPFAASRPTQSNVPLPLTNADLLPPPLDFPLIPPYPSLQEVSSPDLTSPYTEQWNLSIDEALGTNNTLTVSYVGNNGKKLLFTSNYANIPGNPLFTQIQYTNNASSSNYNGLHVQDTGRIANGLDIVASFTYSHALDNASSDYGSGQPVWGNSSADLRRAFNLALNYQTATAGSSIWMHALTHGWLLANRFSAQSGYPLDITQSNTIIAPNGTYIQYRPDLIVGVPLYLHGSAADLNGQPVPANWRLNRDAFALVPTDPSTGVPVRQGTLGRNFVRTPSFWTLNTSLQRAFPIHEELHLIFRVDAFNIFNHPNLTNSGTTSLSESNFGQAVSLATIGSSNSLYAMGASRSLQISLKLQF